MSFSEPSNHPEWVSGTYHRVSAPHVEWGRKVLARLVLRGDETLMDAGCGTGRLTAELLQRLPRGRAVAVDVSENMLEKARVYLGMQFEKRVEFVHADLLSLPFRLAFDGIFSTATFHWVLNHGALFAKLFRALRRAGWLCAQRGGGLNLAQFTGHRASRSAIRSSVVFCSTVGIRQARLPLRRCGSG